MTPSRGACEAPAHLFPVEAEREVVSGALRAASILQEHPNHPEASAALLAVARIGVSEFSQREVGTVVEAIGRVLERDMSLSIGQLLQELRSCRAEVSVLRLLEASYDYGLAPVAGMEATVAAVRRAAEGRRAYWSHLDAAAAIAAGDA